MAKNDSNIIDTDWLDGKGWLWPTGIRPHGIQTSWVFDSIRSMVRKDVTVHIENGRISQLEENAIGSLKAKEGFLNLSNYFVIPGLIDAHSHLSSVYDPYETNAYLLIASANSATLTTHVIRNAQRCLRMGITCIRDMPGFTNFQNQEAIAVREAGSRSLICVPRIVAYGWVEPNAGHMDLALPAKFRADPKVYADGPDGVRRMVRRLIREGVDGFKTALSGGLGGRKEELWWLKYTDDEVLALTKAAHDVGKRVAVHALSDQSIRQGLRCGADTIEHGTLLTPETADIMAEKLVPLVPTLAVASGNALARAQEAGAVSPHQIEKRRALIESEQRLEAVRIAFERGVILATGADAYFTLRGDYWGQNNEEVQLLIEAGLPQEDALKAGTLGSAIAVGLGEEIGAIEKGRYADLIALTRSPIQDPSCLTDPDCIAIVILNGEIVAGSFAGLSEVQAQLSMTNTQVPENS